MVVETPTPIPAGAEVTTSKITIASYIAGYTTVVDGTTSTIPPSTLYVVKNVAVTAAVTTETVSDSTTNLHDFNSHGLWGVTMSLAVVTATLVVMVFV